MSVKPYIARSRSGFTLLELIVSMAIVLVLLVVLVSITNTTQRTWTYTGGKAEQFRNASDAFESITRKLSQATLNTYWDYHYPGSNMPPDRYMRQSELRFICGTLNSITTSSSYPRCPTHAIFFQAPLGYVNDSNYSNLSTLLNTWGYFIEFGTDKASYPDFVNALPVPPKERYRFRLLEMMEPSERLTLYDSESQPGVGNANYTGTDWFTKPLSSPSNIRVVADNVLALIFLPKLAPQEDPSGAILCPNYSYNSIKTNDNNSPTVNASINWKNQLPPIIQVTMVAVDEASFKRFIGDSTAMPDLFTDAGGMPLFQHVGDTLDSTKPGYAKDLETLQKTLQAHKLSYRVFTTNVSIKAAKWSREQTN